MYLKIMNLQTWHRGLLGISLLLHKLVSNFKYSINDFGSSHRTEDETYDLNKEEFCNCNNLGISELII